MTAVTSILLLLTQEIVLSRNTLRSILNYIPSLRIIIKYKIAAEEKQIINSQGNIFESRILVSEIVETIFRCLRRMARQKCFIQDEQSKINTSMEDERIGLD